MLNLFKIKKKLNTDGYVIIKKFFLNTNEFKEFKKYLKNFIKFSLGKKNNQFRYLEKNLTNTFKRKKKLSSFINDNVNLSPFLHSLLTSKKLVLLVSKLFNEKKEKVIINNQRFRVQIPGNDKIANLPWHQDSHYNIIKNTKSIVAWISINNINKKMGPIIFKKASHKLGPQKKIKIQKKNGGSAYTVNVQNKTLKKLKNEQFETYAGDLILIDMNSVHTSGHNNTVNKVKYSAQARFHMSKKNFN